MDDKNLSNNEQNIDEAIAKLDETIAKMSKRLDEMAVEKPKATVTQSDLNKKLIATMVATFVLVISLAVCTYAYFVSTQTSEGNVISTGYAKVLLYNATDPSYPTPPDDTDSYIIFPGYSVSKTVYAENVGTYPVYVRAKIISSITLNERYADHQGEIDPSLVTYTLDLENWTEYNGYYYYNIPVKSGEKTTNMLSSVNFDEQMGNIYKDSTIKVKVILESVQSNNNGTNVFDAVGWASQEEGGTP